jgi:hypothetical protein
MQQTFSTELGALAEALSKAQAVIEGAKEDCVNPFFKSKYADLASVWNACKKPLTANGLSVLQTIENGGEKAYLVTMLLHTSGQWVRSFMPIKTTKDDAQGFGSAVTYCRRYALAAMVGVCPADDDGEAAMHNARKPSYTAPVVISRARVEEIESLLKGRDELRSKLFDWANINSVQELPAIKYEGAMKAIEKYLKEEVA